MKTVDDEETAAGRVERRRNPEVVVNTGYTPQCLTCKRLDKRITLFGAVDV